MSNVREFCFLLTAKSGRGAAGTLVSCRKQYGRYHCTVAESGYVVRAWVMSAAEYFCELECGQLLPCREWVVAEPVESWEQSASAAHGVCV